MLHEIQLTADKLTAQGVNHGDRLAIISAPCTEFVILTLACWKIGAVIAPISTHYPKEKVNSIIKTINPKKLITDLPKSANQQTTPITLDQLALNLDFDASIIFTSGSSGEPKAVLHTIANHYYSALGSHENIPFAKTDAWLASLPMYHISGFSLIMRSLIAGARIIFPAPSQSLQQAIQNSAVTHISLVPTQLIRLLEDPAAVQRLKQLKAILLGGAAIPSQLIDKSLSLNLPIHKTYGQTEAASQIATSAPYNINAVKVLPYRKVKIAPDGVILLKGKTLFKGYIKPGGIDPARDKAGYYHTGDTGTLDQHKYLHITGRKDLMFISGGENIHPEEIERALNNIPNIEQAIVVPVEDPQFGRRPAAFIKTKNNKPIDKENIEEQLTKTLETFKIPKKIFPWPDTVNSDLKPSRLTLTAIANK